jgi:hypothetical protein
MFDSFSLHPRWDVSGSKVHAGIAYTELELLDRDLNQVLLDLQKLVGKYGSKMTERVDKAFPIRNPECKHMGWTLKCLNRIVASSHDTCGASEKA